ncbi:Transmembrane 9 superfamily protein member 1 [Zea mays]|uniref:Transmembrane 9 superfamily member n=1 Tax=Zea mays TaxID=4577 RepID=A0A1D6JVG0_MAIZE|nr:Transmembrane 9 superfamily protein member 1 [Zea mays]
MAMAGFLPFSAIYIELYYIFASVWGHRIYTIYSILFIVFIILLIVTAFITVALTYFQLAAEDHEWWWSSADLFILQVIPLRRINWVFRVRLLPVLLLCAIRHVWLHADIFLLWLHGLHLLCILLDARDGGLPRRPVLCPPHIQINQV